MLPCWVISTQRSGTTYFCDLLNHTDLFNPHFGEKFNLLNRRRCMDMHQHPDKYRHCKIQPEQWDATGLTAEAVKDEYPQIRIIRVYRESVIDKAASLYLAHKTGVWSVAESGEKLFRQQRTIDFPQTAQSKSEYLSRPVEVVEEELKTTLAAVIRNERRAEQICNSFGPYLTVNYEELQNPVAVLEKTINYLMSGIAPPILNSPYTPMPERPEVREIKSKLALLI